MENRHKHAGLLTPSPSKSFKARAFLENTPGRAYQRKIDTPGRLVTEPECTPKKITKQKENKSILEIQESKKNFIKDVLCEENFFNSIKDKRKKVAEMIQLEQSAVKLENENNNIESLPLWEKRLVLMIDVYGKSDEIVESACKKFIMLCNSVAFENINNPIAKQILKVALKYLEEGIDFDNLQKNKVITFNNLSLYYKDRERYDEALKYAKKAFRVCSEIASDDDLLALPDCHLNIGAIFSKLKQHRQALAHANKALEILMERQTQFQVKPSEIPLEALFSSIVVAHNNIAVELEHLLEINKASQFHEKAVRIAKHKLGIKHSVTLRMQSSYERFMKEYYDQDNKLKLSYINKEELKKFQMDASRIISNNNTPKNTQKKSENVSLLPPTSFISEPIPTTSPINFIDETVLEPLEMEIEESGGVGLHSNSLILSELNNILQNH
ncbi:hypothetical protein ABK040_008385 [Willaertia magna]